MRSLPDKLGAIQFTRNQLDRLGIGTVIEKIPWGTKNVKLLPATIQR